MIKNNTNSFTTEDGELELEAVKVSDEDQDKSKFLANFGSSKDINFV